MTLAEGIANILMNGVAIALVCVLVFWCWHNYRVDALRHRLFTLRDELFDYALSSGLAFNDPAYVMLRSSINRTLRFAHNISLPRVLLMASLMRCASFEGILADHKRKWESALSQLPDEPRGTIENLHERVLLEIAKHMVFGSITLLILLSNYVAWSVLLHCRDFFLRKANIVEVEARCADLEKPLPSHA